MIKNERVLSAYKMISFDVSSLFTMVLLSYTIDLTLKRVYYDKEIEVTVAVTSPSDFAPASSKEFLDIQATIECGFTLKRVRDMIKTYSQRN